MGVKLARKDVVSNSLSPFLAFISDSIMRNVKSVLHEIAFHFYVEVISKSPLLAFFRLVLEKQLKPVLHEISFH